MNRCKGRKGIGKLRCKRHDDDGGHGELPTGSRLNERTQICANDMDIHVWVMSDFNKPAGVTQRGGVGSFRVGGICEPRGKFHRWHEVQIVAFKNEPHHCVGRVVENGTDRTDADDKFCDLTDVPRPRLRYLLRADVVSWDGYL